MALIMCFILMAGSKLDLRGAPGCTGYKPAVVIFPELPDFGLLKRHSCSLSHKFKSLIFEFGTK